MKETRTELSRKPSPSTLAVVLYVLAGLCVIVGIGVVLFGLRGDFMMAYRQDVPGVNASIWMIFVNSLFVALAFGAAGTLATYLHDIREYTKTIAEQLCERQSSKRTSENQG